MLRRHDLVYLDQGCGHKLNVLAEHRPLLANWLARGRPFVVGRQDDDDRQLRLGFTIPGTGPRRRVGVIAAFDHVTSHRLSPLLAELLDASLQSWRPVMKSLMDAFAEVGLTPRGYGSLVNQFFSGENCLNGQSDLDVLIDCEHRASAERALAILEKNRLCMPKIDGELRMRQHWAVSWRELAQALFTGGQILVKSDTAVQLLSAHAFLDEPFDYENCYAHSAFNKTSTT